MLKVICSIMIIGCCGAIGFMVANNYSLRANQLRYIQSGLQMLETEIVYGMTPLPKALKGIGKRLPDPIGEFFRLTGEALQERNISVVDSWQEELLRLKKESALMDGELEVLYYFSHTLGSSDIQEQQKSLQLAREQLRQLVGEAEEVRQKNQKIWRCLGISIGAIISLALI